MSRSSAESSCFDQLPGSHVQQQHAAGVADFRGVLAGQAAADFILRQQDLAGLLEVLRLVIPQPEDLRRREAGQGGVGHQLDQIGAAADALFHLGAFGGGPLVVPEDRPANDLVVLVEEHRAVHLARQPDRANRGRLEFRLGHRLADRADRGLPPILGVLLAPERLGEVARVGLHGGGQDRALLVDGQRLGARGADVDAEKHAHRLVVLM